MVGGAGQREDLVDRKTGLPTELRDGPGLDTEPSEGRLGVAPIDREAGRGVEILHVGSQQLGAQDLVRSEEASGEVRGDLQVVLAVEATEVGAVTAARQPFLAVLADRLEQSIPRLEPVVFGIHERPGHQPLGAATNTDAPSTTPPAQTASAAARVQPPVKTVSRSSRHCSASSRRSYDQSIAARSVWWRSTVPRRAAGEQPEALVEALGELPRVHRGHPGRGELDRQRDAVETPADFGDVAAAFFACDVEVRSRRRALARRTAAPRQHAAISATPASAHRQRRATAPRGSVRPRRRAPRGWSPAPRTCGQARSITSTSSAAASRTCSQLSSTSSSSL